MVFSTHGDWYLDQLAPDERAQFESGGLVVRHEDRPGSNVCGAYHPEAYVRDPVPKSLTIVDHIPQGALGNPFQDLWLFQRI